MRRRSGIGRRFPWTCLRLSSKHDPGERHSLSRLASRKGTSNASVPCASGSRSSHWAPPCFGVAERQVWQNRVVRRNASDDRNLGVRVRCQNIGTHHSATIATVQPRPITTAFRASGSLISSPKPRGWNPFSSRQDLTVPQRAAGILADPPVWAAPFAVTTGNRRKWWLLALLSGHQRFRIRSA